MKNLILTAFVFCALAGMSDDGVADGGIVSAPITGNVIRVVNQQKIIDEATLKKCVASMRQYLMLPVELASSDVSDRSGVKIVLVEDDRAGTLVVEPESSKAVINVKALSKDGAKGAQLDRRATVELWRALAFAGGGTDSEFQPCIMRSVLSLKDLDAYPSLDIPSPVVMNKIMSGAEVRGVEMIREDTYRSAYEEGWAPAPATDAQRKIKAEIDAARAAKKCSR